MKTTQLFIGFLFTILMISCSSPSKEKETYDTLMKEVIAVHDEVMPKMGVMNSLIKQLDPKIDTTEAGIKFQEAKSDLQEANKHMMDWMQSFSEEFPYGEKIADEDLAVKIEQLKAQESAVKEMRDKVNASIENAEKVLGTSE